MSKTTRTGRVDYIARGLAKIASGLTIAASNKSFAQYSQLVTLPGTNAGDDAWVFGPDTGTHTDPVSGLTVPNVGSYVWSVSPQGWQWTSNSVGASGYDIQRAALSGAGNSSQTLLNSDAPAGQINSLGNDDAVKLRIAVTTSRLTQGPTAQPIYYDNVFGIGWNISNAFTKINPNIPATSFRIETKFAQGGPTNIFGSEIHIGAHIPIDSGGEIRPHTIFVPHSASDLNNAEFSHSLRGSTFYWLNGSGTLWMQFNAGATGTSINFSGGSSGNNISLVWDKNNKAFAFQNNAANTAVLALPYYDDLNRIYIPAAAKFQGAATLDAGFGQSFLLFANNTAPVAGGAHDIFYSGVAVTGDHRGSVRSGRATGSFQCEVTNQTSGGRGGFESQATNGTSYFSLNDLSNSRYASFKLLNTGDVVIDNSQKGGTAVSWTAITIKQANGQAQFGYQPQLKTSTVAALPAAATAGAGAIGYATNGRKSGEGSGAGTGIPVWCDGTNWRTYYDNTVAAA